MFKLVNNSVSKQNIDRYGHSVAGLQHANSFQELHSREDITGNFNDVLWEGYTVTEGGC